MKTIFPDRKKMHYRKFTVVLVFGYMFILSSLSFTKDTSEKAGDIGQAFLPIAAYTLTFIRHDQTGRDQFYRAFFSSMAVTYALKYGINERRPNGGKHSVVSGHTASAFAGAAFIQRRYGWKLGAPSYALASFVGWSRYHARKHYKNDILRGAAIGIAGAYLFSRPIGKHAVMAPLLGPGTVGLMVSARW
ncbi:MAG: phosphatase PAP2 family protein [Acidobacteria bacterium]|nr:phosphatase PAP2 family protein [Acidobacteriota bacterium]